MQSHSLSRMNFSQYLISYVGMTGRWGLLSHAQHAVVAGLIHTIIGGSSSNIAAVLRKSLLYNTSDCNHHVLLVHTHTTFNISGLVLSLVRGEQQKVKDKGALGFILLFSHLMEHSSYAAACKMQARKCLVSLPDLI